MIRLFSGYSEIAAYANSKAVAAILIDRYFNCVSSRCLLSSPSKEYSWSATFFSSDIRSSLRLVKECLKLLLFFPEGNIVCKTIISNHRTEQINSDDVLLIFQMRIMIQIIKIIR